MKVKKLLLLSLTVLAAMALSSCNGEDNPSTPSSDTVTVTASGLSQVSKTGGSGTVTIKTSGTATVSSDQSWCTVAKTTTSSLGQVYTVTVAKNTETSDRTATITIKVGSTTKTVTVTQLAADGLLITSDTEISVDAAGGTISVTLSSNGDFSGSSSYNGQITETIGASWITSTSTKANMTSYTRTFSVAKNTVASSRTTTISFTLGDITEAVTVTQKAGESSSMSATAMDIAKSMYPGWNLGNTLEAGNSNNLYTNNGGLSAETYWQSTKTTQAIIDFVAEQGFKSVRIPCAWMMGHISDSDNNTIDSKWMARVKEVVDYCISKDLYVILNDHWDGGWLEDSFDDLSSATVAANMGDLKDLWTQIAEEFIDYDEHLLFAGLNEPGMGNSSSPSEESVAALLKYEKTFIDAVRNTGGNNAGRVLIVQGPRTDIDQSYELYDVTKLNDSVEDRLMVEVHYYSPWQFCGLTEDASWGKMWYYWGSSNKGGDSNRTTDSKYNESYVKSEFTKMKTKYYDKGYPVIIGEYGANWRFSDDDLHNASIQAFYKAVNQYAISCGCVPFAWDTNYIGYPSMTIIDRASLSIYNEYMLTGITEGVKAGSWPN